MWPKGAHCDPETTPVIETILPTTATILEETTFTVKGRHLPDTLYAKVPQCTGLSFVSRSAELQEFVCTPQAPGAFAWQVFDFEGGKKLFQGEVTFRCSDCEIEGKCVDKGTVDENTCLVCDPERSQTEWSDNDGASCDDGVLCNGEDLCQGGTCSVHPGDPCEQNGNYCDGTEVCSEEEGGCHSVSPPCQDNGVFCDGTEACDEVQDTCYSTGDPCEEDGFFCNGLPYCDEPNKECRTHAPGEEGTPCPDDGFLCNGYEQCDEGTKSCFVEPPCGLSGFVCTVDQWGQASCLQQVEASSPGAIPSAATRPKLGVWADGSFVLVYSRDSYLYRRFFNEYGYPLGEAEILPSPGFDKTAHEVSALPNGGFLVGAYGSHGYMEDGLVEGFALAEYDGQGALVRGPIVLSGSASTTAPTLGTLLPFPNGQTGVVFRPEAPGYSLEHRLLGTDLAETFGGAASVNPGKSAGLVSAPSAGVGPTGAHIVVWGDEELGVVAERNTGPGMAEQSSTTVVPLTGELASPRVAVDGASNAFVAYVSGSPESTTALVRLVRWGGEPYAAPEAPVTLYDVDVAGYVGVDVAVQPSGAGMVVFALHSWDNSDADIYGRYFDSSGQTMPMGTWYDGVIDVSDWDELGDQTNPVVVAHPNGGFLVAWESFSVNQGRISVRHLPAHPAQ